MRCDQKVSVMVLQTSTLPVVKTVGSWSSIQARHLGPWTCYAVTSAGSASGSNVQTLNLIYFQKVDKSRGWISGWEVRGECGLHNHFALCWHKMALWHAAPVLRSNVLPQDAAVTPRQLNLGYKFLAHNPVKVKKKTMGSINAPLQCGRSSKTMKNSQL